jgi:hypothetical protein
MTDDGDCEAIGGMKIGRENRSSRRKPALVQLCPPKIPHDLTPAATELILQNIESYSAVNENFI